MKTSTIKEWSQMKNLTLTRNVAGELGKVATSIANELFIPLSFERSEDGSKRNRYPEELLVKAWNKYGERNLYCKNIQIIFE
jgi:hypothetical protein